MKKDQITVIPNEHYQYLVERDELLNILEEFGITTWDKWKEFLIAFEKYKLQKED